MAGALVHDDRLNATYYVYDDLDRITQVVLADVSQWTATYDRGHNRRSQYDPRGLRKDFQYDGLGRLRSVEIDDSAAAVAVSGTTVTEFEWDGLDRLTWAFDNNDPSTKADDHAVSMAWDSFGNPLIEEQDGIAIKRRLDTSGNPLEVHSSGSGYGVESLEKRGTCPDSETGGRPSRRWTLLCSAIGVAQKRA